MTISVEFIKLLPTRIATALCQRFDGVIFWPIDNYWTPSTIATARMLVRPPREAS